MVFVYIPPLINLDIKKELNINKTQLVIDPDANVMGDGAITEADKVVDDTKRREYGVILNGGRNQFYDSMDPSRRSGWQ